MNKLYYKTWCRTILLSYKFLEPFANAIDKTVCQFAGNINIGVQEGAEKILDCMEKKVDIINFKVVIQQMLLCLKRTDSALLQLRFFDNMKAEDICDVFDISERSYFRKLERATERLEEQIGLAYNKNQSIFESILKNSHIKTIFKRAQYQIEEESRELAFDAQYAAAKTEAEGNFQQAAAKTTAQNEHNYKNMQHSCGAALKAEVSSNYKAPEELQNKYGCTDTKNFPHYNIKTPEYIQCSIKSRGKTKTPASGTNTLTGCEEMTL